MPSYRPHTRSHGRTLPSLTPKPWHARAKREGISWSLGYFATKQEAQVEEDRFNRAFPRKVNQHG